MNILITGATGFIGSHLVEELVKQDFKVKAFCLYNSQGSCGWIDTLSEEIKSNIEIHLGDIRDYQSVLEGIRGCEFVFHLAALIGIPYSYYASKSYIDTNINGTYNILNASKVNNISKTIDDDQNLENYISSIKLNFTNQRELNWMMLF